MSRKHTGKSRFALHYHLTDPRAPAKTFKVELVDESPDQARVQLLTKLGKGVCISKVRFLGAFVEAVVEEVMP